MIIGIITVHNGQNYGASLQAYALVKKLRNVGFDAYLIDYRAPKIEERLSSYRKKEKNNSLRNVLKNIRLECSELLFNKSGHLILVTKRFEEFHKLILDTHSGEYHVCDEMSVLNKQYDAFICGSDQIWNPNISDLDDSFFLRFADESSKRIAYAPSLGMRSDSVSKEMECKLKEKLKYIQYLSIREENNKDLIEKLTERYCQTVLDPVLLLEKDGWQDLLNSADNACPKEPYAFYYPVIEQPELEKFAMQESRKRGWKLVNPRLIPKYAKLKGYTEVPKSIVGPAEFLKLLVNSEAVFTNSFHATVFSSVYGKELYIIPLKGKHLSRNNRIFEYLKKIELTDVEISMDCSLLHIEESHFETVELVLEQERKKSMKYLLDALS